MMRIMLVNNFYKPFSVSGAEIVTEHLAQSLSVNHEVTVVSTCSPAVGSSQEKLDGIIVHRFFPKNLRWNRERFNRGDPRSKIAVSLWNVSDLWKSRIHSTSFGVYCDLYLPTWSILTTSRVFQRQCGARLEAKTFRSFTRFTTFI